MRPLGWQNNAKNYQLWNHRRKCALALGAAAAERELGVARQALDEDEKNYHAWAHRQAIVKVRGPICTPRRTAQHGCTARQGRTGRPFSIHGWCVCPGSVGTLNGWLAGKLAGLCPQCHSQRLRLFAEEIQGCLPGCAVVACCSATRLFAEEIQGCLPGCAVVACCSATRL